MIRQPTIQEVEAQMRAPQTHIEAELGAEFAPKEFAEEYPMNVHVLAAKSHWYLQDKINELSSNEWKTAQQWHELSLYCEAMSINVEAHTA